MTDPAIWTALAQRCRTAKSPNRDLELDKEISIAAYGCSSLTPITNSFSAVQSLLNDLLPGHWFSVDSPKPSRPLANALIGHHDTILQEERAVTVEYATLAAMFEILAVGH